MKSFEYKNYIIEPAETESLLEIAPPRDGFAKTFKLTKGKDNFRIRLRITGIDLAILQKNGVGDEALEELFERGIKRVIDQFYLKEDRKLEEWEYFNYDKSGDWLESNESF